VIHRNRRFPWLTQTGSLPQWWSGGSLSAGLLGCVQLRLTPSPHEACRRALQNQKFLHLLLIGKPKVFPPPLSSSWPFKALWPSPDRTTSRARAGSEPTPCPMSPGPEHCSSHGATPTVLCPGPRLLTQPPANSEKVLAECCVQVTESQNSRGWKGPLWVI